MQARAWSEIVHIPTYHVGPPNPNPMFLEKRVYQGSCGVVYPHPVIESIEDEKRDHAWTGVFLENEWLKILVLPELGGRVQMALDKTNGYNFVYYNRVIKPALVGLAGPWISGGIEFNWPQHHRPSTYQPVDWRIEDGGDGSVTVWCGEVEKMFRTQGVHGFRLYPDRAYLEIDVRLYNRTSEPQTFLWWANPAVHVHDAYQSVFPPDVHAVMDHGKRDVSTFPIATGEYYKVDYAPGTDISRYKNIPVPTSYMAYHSDYNFVGCYDHEKRAGMMHVANHHVVPGKKQWTWGDGDFGRAWDRQLTDEDGPYIELMCGAFTDNQPDFSWLMPGEEKRFKQVFMPYKEVGPASNASRDAVVSMEVHEDTAQLGAYVTRPGAYTMTLYRDKPPKGRIRNHKNMELPLVHPARSPDAERIFETTVTLSPEKAWREEVRLPGNFQPLELVFEITSNDRKLLAHRFQPLEEPATPDPATAARRPEDIESNEELYLNGLHLEQYRHATYEPEPYYVEALRRDPGDARCNNAMGLLLYTRGAFAEAEAYFRKAIERLTLRNPNPYDGEPYYHLGLCLKMQALMPVDDASREALLASAYDAFYKSAWNAAWQAAGYFELARLDAWNQDFGMALDHLGTSLSVNGRNQRAYLLKIALLRRSGRTDAARKQWETLSGQMPLSLGGWFEGYRLGVLGEESCPAATASLEQALDYIHAGLMDDAAALLGRIEGSDAMARYYRAWAGFLSGHRDEAKDAFREAAGQDRSFAFPHQLECVPALETALCIHKHDALAAYALGNFRYAHRRHREAIANWWQSIEADPGFPTARRNLALALVNKQGDPDAAETQLAEAFRLNPRDARVLFEWDQLRKKRRTLPGQRLENLARHRDLVLTRDDLCVEYVTLLNLAGREDDALDILQERRFTPWEGGEGKTTMQYVLARLLRACRALARDEPETALAEAEAARVYPENLAEGKLAGARENHVLYLLGHIHERVGSKDIAVNYWRQATEGPSEPASAMYYNDQPPDMLFYQGLALRRLGLELEAQDRFQRLLTYGEQHLDNEVAMDYFAVSLPDFLVFDEDLSRRNRIHCLYMMALGYHGLGRAKEAEKNRLAVLGLEPAHAGAMLHLGRLAEAC